MSPRLGHWEFPIWEFWEGGNGRRLASQETCRRELCFGGVVGAGCTGRERVDAGIRATQQSSPDLSL